MTSIGVGTREAGVPGLQHERGSPVGSSKLLDELQGVMKLHTSRPRLKLLFEQLIISGTQALLGK